MAAGYSFLADIFASVNAASSSYISDTTSGVIAAALPVALQCFTLYVILWGFAFYRGMVQEPIMDATFRLARIGLILGLAVNLGRYNAMVADNLVALPDYFVQLFGASGTPTASWTTLDSILSDFIDVGVQFWEQGSLIPPGANPGAYFEAILVWISGLLVVGYAAFLLVLSKLALVILVAMGPIFVLCLMFDGTKKFFESWLGQVLNYAFMSALTVAVVKLLLAIFQTYAHNVAAQAAADDFGLTSCMGLLVLAVICFLVLSQVMSIASGIAGGVAISTLGAAMAATRMAKNTASSMRPSNMQRSARQLKRDWRATPGTKHIDKAAAAASTWARRKVGGRNSVSKAA